MSNSNANAVVRDLERIAAIPLTDVGREAMASLLASAGRFEVGKAVTAVGDDEVEVEVEAWFRAALTRFPVFVAKPDATEKDAKSTNQPAGNRTERAIATNAARKADKAAEAKALVQQHGNPWKTGNLTHKMFLKNVAPDLAAKMQMEASQ